MYKPRVLTLQLISRLRTAGLATVNLDYLSLTEGKPPCTPTEGEPREQTTCTFTAFMIIFAFL